MIRDLVVVVDAEGQESVIAELGFPVVQVVVGVDRPGVPWGR